LSSAVPEKGRTPRTSTTTTTTTTRTHNFALSVITIYAKSPCSATTFIVNSEPHTGARPSARLCVGLLKYKLITYRDRTPVVHRKTIIADSPKV
jgi:hypothetical protein